MLSLNVCMYACMYVRTMSDAVGDSGEVGLGRCVLFVNVRRSLPVVGADVCSACIDTIQLRSKLSHDLQYPISALANSDGDSFIVLLPLSGGIAKSICC